MWRPEKEKWEKVVRDSISRTGGLFNADMPVIFESDRRIFEAGADSGIRSLVDHLLSYPDDAIPDELRAMKEVD